MFKSILIFIFRVELVLSSFVEFRLNFKFLFFRRLGKYMGSKKINNEMWILFLIIDFILLIIGNGKVELGLG